MGVIHQLSDEVINKIAAGEVVERPASVVKELVENSLDAGSTQVDIIIEDGGKKSITIKDNGEGILPEDLKLAVSRHSTSKLSTEKDLFSLKTMGFRGEALASIASVSKFSIKSKKENHPAQELVIDGGKLVSESETGHSVGTTVSVKYLFYQTPARLKFLKTKETELSHINDYITKVALSHPEIGFSLHHQNRKIIKVPQNQTLKERIKSLFGKEIVDFSYEVNFESENIKVNGFCCHPQINRSHAKNLYHFVNHRPVKDRIIYHASIESYRDLLMKGRYPFVILFIEINPEEVDVNVHPQKTEVRFSDGKLVHKAVYEAIRSKLIESPWQNAASQSDNNEDLKENKGKYLASSNYFQKNYSNPSQNLSSTNDNNLFSQMKRSWEDIEKPKSISENNESKEDFFQKISKNPQIGVVPYHEMEVIGQLLGTYILCQSHQKLILIDQHAAHERVRFEKLLSQYENSKIETQPLLIPENFDLSFSETEILKKYLEEINQVGLEIDFFGGNTFVLKSLPMILEGRIRIKPFIQDLIGDILDKGSLTSLKDRIHHLLATMACHSAIRAHHLLTKDQIQGLMEELDRYQLTSFCPHGRPVYIEVSEYELEKWFKRVV